MLKLLRGWLRSGVLDGVELINPDTGTPQGGVISPLLANIALTALDRAFEARGPRVRLVRYADDFVVVAPTEGEARESQQLAADVLSTWGLRLHPDKTRIVGLDRMEGFDFLGFHHRLVESRRTGRRYLRTEPSAKAKKRARARVREETSRRMLFRALEDTVVVLNRFLGGWVGYFRRGQPLRVFAALDWYIHRRLAYHESMRHGGHRWASSRYPFTWSRQVGIIRLASTVRPRAMTHATR
jgi:RNA-directed DNA polymerase